MRYAWLLLGLVLGWGAVSAEEIVVPPDVVQQLKRLEPLTPEKIQVFVDAGVLTPKQAALVLRNMPQGVLNLPADRIGVPSTPAVPAAPIAPAAPPAAAGMAGDLPRLPGGRLDVLRILARQDQTAPRTLSDADRERIAGNLQGYRYLNAIDQENIRRDFQRIGDEANPLVAAVYNDPVDFDIKFQLWTYLANAGNPRAAGYIAKTHQLAMNKAVPVLIPYDKDAGGLIFRRMDGNAEPVRKWYSSREMRDYITETERLISHCVGPRAAIYLMSVYENRYGGGEAPMRDKGRDRDRMVRACGGDHKEMDQDEPETWGCSLSPLDRVLAAERLVPYLNHHEKDVREIARYGLLVLNSQPNKRLRDFFKDAREHWGDVERWWAQRREEMLAQAR